MPTGEVQFIPTLSATNAGNATGTQTLTLTMSNAGTPPAFNDTANVGGYNKSVLPMAIVSATSATANVGGFQKNVIPVAVFALDNTGNWIPAAPGSAFDPTQPGPIGGTTPAAGAFTNLSSTGVLVANGVQVTGYLDIINTVVIFDHGAYRNQMGTTAAGALSVTDGNNNPAPLFSGTFPFARQVPLATLTSAAGATGDFAFSANNASVVFRLADGTYKQAALTTYNP